MTESRDDKLIRRQQEAADEHAFSLGMSNASLDLVRRLQAASYAVDLAEHLEEIADEVRDLDVAGASERDIDRRVRRWMKEQGVDFESWAAEVRPELEASGVAEHIDLNKVWKAYGVEPWLQNAVRSVAFTHEPIPFLPFAAGFWLEDDISDPPTLIAVLTPLSDPHLAARQLVEKHKRLFGKQASGRARKDEVFNARMLARNRAGQGYTFIAVQNLREDHPDIVRNEYRYRAEIKAEKERVAKAIRAAEKLWKERGFDSSTGD